MVAIADFLGFLAHDAARKAPAHPDRAGTRTVGEHRGKHRVVGLEPGGVIADALVRIQRAAGLNGRHAQRTAGSTRTYNEPGDDECRCCDKDAPTYQLTSQLYTLNFQTFD